MPQTHFRREGWNHGSSGLRSCPPSASSCLYNVSAAASRSRGWGRGMPDSEVYSTHSALPIITARLASGTSPESATVDQALGVPAWPTAAQCARSAPARSAPRGRRRSRRAPVRARGRLQGRRGGRAAPTGMLAMAPAPSFGHEDVAVPAAAARLRVSWSGCIRVGVAGRAGPQRTKLNGSALVAGATAARFSSGRESPHTLPPLDIAGPPSRCLARGGSELAGWRERWPRRWRQASHFAMRASRGRRGRGSGQA